MCGIAGIIAPSGRTVAALDIKLMSGAMEHRGPDDLGYLGWSREAGVFISRDPLSAVCEARLALAHRRLSIIDEGEGGWQPMATSDGRFAIVFNGEIYNYLELRAELQGEGISFATHSDTEVLLNALAAWGVEKTLPRLTGMFAFALLDTVDGALTLARDPFGIKPLSYARVKGGLAFASEIASLLCVSGVSRRVEPSALYDYLRFGLTDRGARTLFAGIEHLPPAHFAVVDLTRPDQVVPRRYWRAELGPTLDIGFDEAATELRRLFLDSVRLHLRSDVPVGAALSGGIDSSAVVGAMRALEGDGLDLHTFTFVAAGSNLNEEAWADMAADAAHATPHKVSLTGRQLVDGLDALIAAQGEPFGSTSIFAQNRVFSLARQNGIKVTLDGQGADEILAGYTPFLAARLATMAQDGEWGRALRFWRGLDAKTGVALRAMRFVLPQALQGPARRLVGEGLMPGWMDVSWFARQGVRPVAPQKPVRGDVLRHELAESLTDRVLPSLLRYQDRNSMAHSVESRVPFLTTALVEFLYSLPEAFLISDQGVTKAVFRRAARGLAPDAILDRRDKIGFAAPEETWLAEAGEWLDGVLSSDMMNAIPAFDSRAMSQEIEAVRSGGRRLTGDVWRWVNLARWAEFFDVRFE
ncbi:MAG: asparagine synthase (glutamine-hydrolyzing) [Alphaproteobacteria bacterium]|nr:asparagine synthase (glutamine-hydrolyzing) [Alphaproteobacteria bacterium]